MDNFQLPLTFDVKTLSFSSHVSFPEYTGAAQADCASAILQVAAVLYKGAFSLNKSLRKRCKLNHIYVAQR